MDNQFSRTQILIGQKAIDKLAKSRVAVFGIGGVGGYAVEALVRSGLGAIDIIDDDNVSVSNINRQIYATNSTVGRPKVEVAKERILDINPNCIVNTYKNFYNEENSDCFEFDKYDYIVDAIDTVSAKISLIEKSKKYNVPIICSMGAGNKMDPTKFEVSDISKTSVCPLARIIRNELKKRKISKVKCVYSKEIPIKPEVEDIEIKNNKLKHKIPGSIAFVPSIVGLIIASEVIKDLIGFNK
jgi:tRNA A37 threonylcarbamoyladenosine dehydratase